MTHDLTTLNNYQIGCKSKGGHSRKECWCGGHNLNNVSRNLNHSGTKNKLLIRKSMLLREVAKL